MDFVGDSGKFARIALFFASINLINRGSGISGDVSGDADSCIF